MCIRDSTQADTVQLASSNTFVVQVLNDLPATQAKHTQVHMYTADVSSSQRWDQTIAPPQIVPLNSNNKKGPDTTEHIKHKGRSTLSVIN